MRHSYCILAHDFSHALVHLVSYLSNDVNNSIFIHVDAKSDISEFLTLISHNVKIIDDRVNVRWGGIEMINATISLLKNVEGDGFCTLLSGDDFPCKTLEELNYFFSNPEVVGKNLIHFQDGRNSFVDPKIRFNYIYPHYFFKKNRTRYEKFCCWVYKKFPRKKNLFGCTYLREKNIQLFKGTQWFSLNKKSLDKILDFLENNNDYYKSFMGTFCADEIFFHTLIKYLRLPTYHDPLAVNDCLRYVDWTTGPQYPKLLDETDLERISDSKCLFARKASPNIDFRKFYIS